MQKCRFKLFQTYSKYKFLKAKLNKKSEFHFIKFNDVTLNAFYSIKSNKKRLNRNFIKSMRNEL